VASFANVTTAQTTHHLVGPAPHRTLQLLVGNSILQEGHTVELRNIDDDSLERSFTQRHLTFTGTGTIAPSDTWISSRFYSNTTTSGTPAPNNNAVTLNSSFFEFANFTNSVLYSHDVNINGNGTNVFTNNRAAGLSGGGTSGGAIYVTGTATLDTGTNIFTGNSANSGGGAISGGTTTLTNGTNEFTGNSANYGGAINGTTNIGTSGTNAQYGGTNTFTSNRANSNYGGAINGSTTIHSGVNEFKDNRAASYGGAISGTTVINGGKNTFTENLVTTSGYYGGAIFGATTINNGENTFTGNRVGGNGYGYGGAIYSNGSNITISGGTNTFTDNRAGSTTNISHGGGAIYGSGSTTSITGGTNVFTGNSTSSHGGAIYGSGTTTSISGGTNTFTDNTARGRGGAIYTTGTSTTLRAMNRENREDDGDIIFSGNRDRVATDGTGGTANALHVAYNTGTNAVTLNLAAQAGRSITFYDPVTSADNSNLRININSGVADTGNVVFDGSLYKDMDALNRHSAVTGQTSVNYGSLILNGGVTYGASNALGFTLNDDAKLVTDNSVNRIHGDRITFYGDVEIAKGGTLELIANTANANSVRFYNTMTTGLGMNSYGSLAVTGNLTFYEDSMLSLYWDDDLDSLYDGWKQEYSFFDVGGNMSGLANLALDMSDFDAYEGFSYTWNNSIGMLTLTYNSEVPEPATLAIIGLGLAGLGWARRRRR